MGVEIDAAAAADQQGVGHELGVVVAADAAADVAAHGKAAERGLHIGAVAADGGIVAGATEDVAHVEAYHGTVGHIQLQAAGQGLGEAFAVVAACGDVDDGVAGAADVVVAEQILQERADKHIIGRLLQMINRRAGVGHADAALGAAAVKAGA